MKQNKHNCSDDVDGRFALLVCAAGIVSALVLIATHLTSVYALLSMK